MKHDPDKHHRKSTRLKGYDYSSAGAYFVTICAYKGECIFGEIKHGKIHPSEFGEVVETEWLKSQEIRGEIELDEFQIMPNHFHAIVFILDLPENRIRGDKVVGANGRYIENQQVTRYTWSAHFATQLL